jgi:DNA-binding beta-propeller fold protein YncE
MRNACLLHLWCLILAACGLATACESSGPKPVAIRGNSLALVDPRSNDVIADVPVGRAPTRVAYGQEAFWVVSPEAGVVVRVDAETKRAARFRIGEDPFDAAVGAGALWVPDHDGQRLLRFDLDSHEIRATQSFGLPAISVGVGFGSVWVAVADGSVLRINPRTLRTQATVRDATTTIEGSEPKLAFANGSIWISSPAESNVARIDPERETVERQPLVEAMGISAGAGAVWVADNASAVWRFGGPQPQRMKVGAQPQDVAATSKAVWVTESGDQTLVRLDPASRRVVARIKFHHHPIAVAAGRRVVAVALT